MVLFSTAASPAMAFMAQEKLLSYFLKRSIFEKKDVVKTGLNYVTVTRDRSRQSSSDIIERSSRRQPRTLVLMHGFGLGLGFFYENYDYFAQNFDRVIAVDWPGMGCSSRDTVQLKKLRWLCSMPSRAAASISKEEYAVNLAKQVTDEFVDSLESLREEEGLTDFVLAGHSLGGFLAGKYAVKYPEHVKGLVLISPVGIPRAPPQELRVASSALDWRIRLLKYLWEMNFTPQSIVRFAGSRGPELVKSAVDRRFSKQWEATELKIVSDYMYQITALPANGEYALNTLLEPVFIKETTARSSSPSRGPLTGMRSGVFAKDPMEEELCSIKVPLLLLYGDNDWLYYPTAKQSIELWKQHGVDAELRIISNAGHHLYMDNAPEFNRSVVDWALRHLLL